MDALYGTKHRSPELGDQLGFAQSARSDRFDLRVQVVHELMIKRQGGLLGQMLQLALATEQTDPEVLEDALRRVPGISVEFLEDCLRQAFYWANNLGREKTDDA